MIKLILHKTVDDVIQAFFKPKKVPKTGKWVWFDSDGEKCEMPILEFKPTILKSGVWGFIGNKRVIHAWVDKNRVSFEDLLSFISHELGHAEHPWYKSGGRRDEIKAARYAEVAVTAFKIANDIMEGRTHDRKSRKNHLPGTSRPWKITTRTCGGAHRNRSEGKRK